MTALKRAYQLASSIIPKRHSSLKAHGSSRTLFEKTKIEWATVSKVGTGLFSSQNKVSKDSSFSMFKLSSMQFLAELWSASEEHSHTKHLQTDVLKPTCGGTLEENDKN